MRKKRYCIFSAQYFPHLGGVERYTFNIVQKLVEKGNEVTIVTSNTDYLDNYEKIDKIEIFRMPCYNMLKGRYPVLKMNSLFKRIHQELKKRKFDFIIINTRFYLHSLYGQWFGWKNEIKEITIDHGTSHLSVHNKMLDYIGGGVEHSITRIGKFFCKDYYGVSLASTKWLEHFNIKAKGVLYNAVDVNHIQSILESPKRNFRKEFMFDEKDTVICFTGRLLKEKGIVQIIETVKKYNEINASIKLIIAGDGDLEQYVVDNEDSNIKYTGRLEFNEVIDLLRISDIFCLPSDSEGFSTAILEAVVCHCYIITTQQGGAKELLITDEYGSIMKNNLSETIYSTLCDVIPDKKKRERGIQLSLSYLLGHFTWDIVVDELLKIQ
ncbi:glycosyltransferase family 4 protein [Eubacterium sp.]|uniref:glycosyltransferase family 4 protein n=1 Tax=Eubacterium sp. TaxID=142586 RepID=UPI002FC59001